MKNQNDEFLSANCQRFQEVLERRWADDCEHSQVDTASLDRHRRECTDCALFADALESFGEDDADTRNSVTSRNEIRSLVDTAFADRSKKNTFKYTAAAAVAAVIIGTFAFLTTYNYKTTIGDDGRFELLAGSLKIDNQEIISGDRFDQIRKTVTPIRDNALVAADGALFVAIGEGASLQVVRSLPKEIRLGLTQGRVAVHLTPGSGISLDIQLPDGDVSVTGTVFIVEVVDGKSRVEVVRGKVVVNSNAANPSPPVKLAAGYSLALLGKQQPRVSIADDPLLALLGISDATGQQLADNQVPLDDEESPSESPEEAETVASTPSTNSKTTGKNTHVHSNDSLDESPEFLLRQARSCRAAMDWDCATKSYKRLIKSYPKLPDATTALIPLGQILLERTNRPKAALKYFKRYLKRRPTGGLAPEAQWGKCNSYRALSQSDKERQCLEGFLSNYHGNLNARIAKFRLEEL